MTLIALFLSNAWGRVVDLIAAPRYDFMDSRWLLRLRSKNGAEYRG
jgi:hypothetical protein